MNKKLFGTISTGAEVYTYEIANRNGMRMVLTDLGAAVVSVYITDKNGVERDIVLGYDHASSYENGGAYFGATVGRNANRIFGAKVQIEGITYQLEEDSAGNNLHSGSQSVAKRLWNVKYHEANRITFSIISLEELEGFPGDAALEVTYELTEDNEAVIIYHGLCDKTTVFNLTNHTYWNLNGQDSGPTYSQELQIFASNYVPLHDFKEEQPGTIASVQDTPFDFRKMKTIGCDIHTDNEQMKLVNGFDHNYALDKKAGEMKTAAIAYASETGIRMEVITDCPGIQFYTANHLNGQKGKGTEYVNHGAYCLETQFFPNAVNVPEYASPIIPANTPYTSTTIYKFTV